MKVDVGASIHNRFIIEVRNKDTNELKQKGIAENIVLNRMYSRLCSLNTFFTNIHFGNGEGTLSTSKTSLFNPVGVKSAVVDEVIKSFPVSRVTKSIRLNPEEYVGYTFTEV